MKKLQLMLTKPCTQQWSEIEKENGEHFCNKCEKSIVDLTGKSDEELFHFFQHKTSEVCGRLLSSQLNRNLALPSTNNWYWMMPVALAAVMISSAQAQNAKSPVIRSDQAPKMLPSSRESSSVVPPLNTILNGSVVDDLKGIALVGVKLRKKGFENVLAITDSAGRFEFRINDHDTLSTYTFLLPGFSPAEAGLSDSMVIRLKKVTHVMLGGVSFISNSRQPLYILSSGNISCTIDPVRLSQISPDWIEKIDILEDAEAAALYGAKDANGVIVIGIKKAFKKKINFSN
ncbi:hypothetical protein GJU39_09690 [Pedobacter petrophilus]|uniref:TonB-dependent receptor plug domain-containing protein n=1 Tax=Pedobacter petrophilus TaxID=1908241 RepID=A0A7K0FYS9_9SPHI|nr:hypothetical protein [Pedobacter petrophilus]MRX76360.1 hypothetical protein [Pedobacter petrophilus]